MKKCTHIDGTFCQDCGIITAVVDEWGKQAEWTQKALDATSTLKSKHTLEVVQLIERQETEWEEHAKTYGL